MKATSQQKIQRKGAKKKKKLFFFIKEVYMNAKNRKPNHPGGILVLLRADAPIIASNSP